MTLLNTLPREKLLAIAEAKRRGLDVSGIVPPPDPEIGWPTTYTNRATGKTYAPHHAEEGEWLADREHRYLLAKGGEGSGKSVVGIIKDLEWLKLGVAGIMGSPDLQHFKKSLWPEFKAWCPWEMVVPEQRYRARDSWHPHEPFILNFVNGAVLICGGFEEAGAWEGPNVTFAHFDEARRHKRPDMLKVLDGRCRIPGPNGEKPQLYMTTTPRKHWLFEFFGPLLEADPFASFKLASRVMTLRTEDNERAGNLADGYTRQRAQSLTDAERRVLLEAGWEDENDVDRFLPSILLWDACKEDLPPLDREPMVLGVDAGVDNDCFGLIGVTRHPLRHDDVAARLVRLWEPRGQKLDFSAIEAEITEFVRTWHVVCITYDPYQLHQMMEGLYRRGVVWTDPFSQQGPRLLADKQLLDLIMYRRIAHDGNPDLRRHIENADRKVGEEQGKLRLVKRSEGMKIDLAVALSMATARCLELNL